MTFHISAKKVLTYNGFKIVDLNAPFVQVFDIRVSKNSWKRLIKTPYQVIAESKNSSAFVVKHSKYLYSKLYRVTFGTLKAQAVYLTNKNVSLHFRSKAISKLRIVKNQDTKTIFDIFDKIVLHIAEQFPFDIIETDFGNNGKTHYLTNICNIENPDTVKVLSILLTEYGKIPLHILSRDIFEEITVENTDIDLSIYANKSVLFFTLQNIYYAGFFGRELLKVTREVLPVSMFKNIEKK